MATRHEVKRERRFCCEVELDDCGRTRKVSFEVSTCRLERPEEDSGTHREGRKGNRSCLLDRCCAEERLELALVERLVDCRREGRLPPADTAQVRQRRRSGSTKR